MMDKRGTPASRFKVLLLNIYIASPSDRPTYMYVCVADAERGENRRIMVGCLGWAPYM